MFWVFVFFSDAYPIGNSSIFWMRIIPCFSINKNYKDNFKLEFSTIHKISWPPWWLRWWSICPQCGRPEFNPWVGKIPWRRKWQPTPVFLTGKFHGRRSLEGSSPGGRREPDTTERLQCAVMGLDPTERLHCAVMGLHVSEEVSAASLIFVLLWLIFSTYGCF